MQYVFRQIITIACTYVWTTNFNDGHTRFTSLLDVRPCIRQQYVKYKYKLKAGQSSLNTNAAISFNSGHNAFMFRKKLVHVPYGKTEIFKKLQLHKQRYLWASFCKKKTKCTDLQKIYTQISKDDKENWHIFFSLLNYVCFIQVLV